jgi:hypothetical protein
MTHTRIGESGAAPSAASGFFEVRGFAFHDGRTIPTVRLHNQTLGTP